MENRHIYDEDFLPPAFFLPPLYICSLSPLKPPQRCNPSNPHINNQNHRPNSNNKHQTPKSTNMPLPSRTKLAFNTTAFLLGYACTARLVIEISKATGHNDNDIHPLILYEDNTYIVFAPLAVLLGRAGFNSWAEYGRWWRRAILLVAGHLTARAQVLRSRPFFTVKVCCAAVLGIMAGSFVTPLVSERTASILLIGLILVMLCGRVWFGSWGECCR